MGLDVVDEFEQVLLKRPVRLGLDDCRGFAEEGRRGDAAEEIAKLEAELKYQQDFLASVRKKLSNESFVAHAPAKVVEMERKKEADSLSKIESYENQLKALRK